MFEFRYRSLAMLQAMGIAPSLKREAPSTIIDVEDEDILPPPKRKKGKHGDDLVRSMEVRLKSLHEKSVQSSKDSFRWNRRSWRGCGAGWLNLKASLLVSRRRK